MRLSRANVPASFDRQAYDQQPERKLARREYRKSERGKEAERKYRHDNSKWITDAAYLSKRIVNVDGEGINLPDGSHSYVLLAATDVPPLVRRGGITTKEALTYLWENLDPDDINTIYGGSYDFNMWLRGRGKIDEDVVRRVYKSTYLSPAVKIEGFKVRWIKGKNFQIEKNGKKIVIYDVVSFFQKPAVAAFDEYLGPEHGWTPENREIIVREKARRGVFKPEELDGMTEYNNLELKLYVALVEELRARLNRVGLRPRRWDGPGAIAAALFLREKIKRHRNENMPPEVARAARFAYAGGRFEVIKYGFSRERAYEYDVNSAYPRALLEVPSLSNGTWQHHTGIEADRHFRFGLYRVRYSGKRQDIPGPIFHRAPNGTISYPLEVENWIWTPEMEVLRKYCAKVPGAKYRVLEAWEYVETENQIRPFRFILPLYNKRQALKAEGNGAHVGIKLALNSIYGKLAQQVGWTPATENYPLRIPSYHQLEWAGFTTSHCRAAVLSAALENLESVIAFETDALFTTAPLKVQVGSGLGEWEATEFQSLTYVQSGHYYGTAWNPKQEKWEEVVKCRGIDRGFIQRASVEERLRLAEPQRTLSAALTRFYGVGIALTRGLSEFWCKWLTEPKVLFLGPAGKRLHGACWCESSDRLEEGWHRTFSPVYGGMSSEFPVEWINPNPAMQEALTEQREAENEYDD